MWGTVATRTDTCMSSGRKERRQTTLFAYGIAMKPKRIRLRDFTPPDHDSGTESDESAKINRDLDHSSDGSLSSESDDERETRHRQSGGNQSITVHAPTTVVLNKYYNLSMDKSLQILLLGVINPHFSQC